LSSPATDRYVATPQTPDYKPTRPGALILEDEKFTACPHEDPQVFVCMDAGNARKMSRNKLKIVEYVKDSNAVINFYERSGTPSSH